MAAFTVESKVIALSLAGSAICAGWWTWCNCGRERSGKRSGSLTSRNEAAVISLTLFLVACAYSTTVREIISTWTGQMGVVPAIIVLGAAALLPLSFESIFSSKAPLCPVEPSLPNGAATMLLIKQRRSIFPKDYNGAAVPREAIERALEAANWAPTHGKTESWRFTVFSGHARIMQLEDEKRIATEACLSDQPDKLAAALEKIERKRKDMSKVRQARQLAVTCE